MKWREPNESILSHECECDCEWEWMWILSKLKFELTSFSVVAASSSSFGRIPIQFCKREKEERRKKKEERRKIGKNNKNFSYLVSSSNKQTNRETYLPLKKLKKHKISSENQLSTFVIVFFKTIFWSKKTLIKMTEDEGNRQELVKCVLVIYLFLTILNVVITSLKSTRFLYNC